MSRQPTLTQPILQDDADGHWLAGLADGEGSFTLYTRRRRLARYPGREYRSLNFSFKISLRADDAATLREAHQILGGIGTLYFTRKSRTVRVGPFVYDGNPLRGFAITSHDDIPAVIAFFRRYPLRSKKQRDFLLWAEAFERYTTVLAATARGVCDYRKQLKKSAKKRRPVAGMPLKRFRTIPDGLYEELRRYEQAIKDTRRYLE